MTQGDNVNTGIEIGDSIEVKTVRGWSLESWPYIYVFLGFALTIEGTVIQMITPLPFPCNILEYIIFGAVTIWLFLFNGWFQNNGIMAQTPQAI